VARELECAHQRQKSSGGGTGKRPFVRSGIAQATRFFTVEQGRRSGGLVTCRFRGHGARVFVCLLLVGGIHDRARIFNLFRIFKGD